MTISYKWLSEYLPVQVEPEKLNRILTSIGLEVEGMHRYEEFRGGLQGLVIGQVQSTAKHPNADKLTLTQVDTGNGKILQIVCGAPNVAAGQKVVVALPGTTIYPSTGEPITLRLAKIRGEESNGMICAEDEIGMGTSHEGIMVLPAEAETGATAASYFQPYEDIIFEIGLTPNRMDAMSHWGVARDVCAYLSHHDKKELKAKIPHDNGFKADDHSLVFNVKIENEQACPRYSGVSLTGVTVKESPAWLKQRLRAIGLRPINNIVDITNYIQHETGQPLHAFDADNISGKTIIVKSLPEGSKFTTLDEKVRLLSSEDLVICDNKGGLCIAGVFGGLNSGVTEKTSRIFLESACFDPLVTRKTSFRHGLRTDAASRFEKGTDISATVVVLKRAASMIRDIAGARVSSEVVDIYPDPKSRNEVGIKYHYLKKLSGKNYHPDTMKNILSSLGFGIVKEGMDELRVSVPYHKTDISLPADLVEEILRIDGLDNIDIPGSITITPSIEEFEQEEIYREKTSAYLAGTGFSEIITNSITQSAYFSEEEQQQMVRMLNSLSSELNIMRNSLLETSLEVVAHNLNHRNLSLKLFEFGKAYNITAPGKYNESKQLCLVVTGNLQEPGWKTKSNPADFFYLKGLLSSLFTTLSVNPDSIEQLDVPKLDDHIIYKKDNEIIGGLGRVRPGILEKFGIKQPVFFAGLNWDYIVKMAAEQQTVLKEIPRYPSVQRDLAMIVARDMSWEKVEKTVHKIRLEKLREVKLFDIFESEKLGTGKKSMAVNFTFLDHEKTLTDKEIDEWMNKLMTVLEKDLQAEIRK